MNPIQTCSTNRSQSVCPSCRAWHLWPNSHPIPFLLLDRPATRTKTVRCGIEDFAPKIFRQSNVYGRQMAASDLVGVSYLSGIYGMLHVCVKIPVQFGLEQLRQACGGTQIPGCVFPSSLQGFCAFSNTSYTSQCSETVTVRSSVWPDTLLA